MHFSTHDFKEVQIGTGKIQMSSVALSVTDVYNVTYVRRAYTAKN